MRFKPFGGSMTERSWVGSIGKAAWFALGLILGLGQGVQGQVTVFSEGFEGAFPQDNGWTVGDANGGNGVAFFWEDVNAAFGGEGAQSGNWKGYCAGTRYVFNSSEANPTYDNFMTSFMQRPIDLTPFGCATLEFWYKIPSIETCCDALRVTVDGTQVFIQNNPVAGWTQVIVDLGPFLGGVRTLRFEFVSDISITVEGAYLDSIRVTGTVPPGNDNFAVATVINGPSGTAAGNNICATAQPGEPVSLGRTVWWSWQSPVCCPVTFNTFGSSYDTLLCVFTGPNVGALTTVGCNDDSGGGLQSRVDFTPTERTTYWIRVDGFDGAQGSITLNWGVNAAPPANDNFVDAQVLEGPVGTIGGHNCNATAEPSEATAGGLGGGHSIWYRWQSPTCCPMKFSTLGSCFDTVLCVYTGDSLNALTAVACNDDFSGKGLQSRAEFTATQFTTYWIQVDGYFTLGGREGDVVLSWQPNVPAPANNQFASAIPLPGARGVVNGHTCNATSEAGEPIDSRASGHTVWYSWDSGAVCCPVYFSTLGACFDTVMCVYSGPNLTSLTPVVCNDDSFGKGLASRVTFNSQVGTRYWIQVDGYFSLGGRVGEFVLQYGPDGLPPDNDQFANATVLVGASGSINGFNCSATREDFESVDFRGGGNTVWYKWTAPNANCVFFNTVGSCFDTVLSVFEGSTLNDLAAIATSNDDFPGKGVQSRVEFRTQAGRTYWIQVDGFEGAMGNITLNWGGDATPPLNDNFAGATFLPGTSSGRVLGGNCNATGEAGEPANSGRTVWWRWTAQANGCAWFSTLGSDFDTVLCVYRGGSLATLTQVGCVDDSVGKDVRSRLEFTATAGTVYWIRVDGFNGAVGNIALRWGNGPENDTLANATPLDPAGTITGNNRCSTLEAGELNVAPGGGKTIWYRWTAPSSGCPRYFFSSRGSSFDTVLCVFHGAGGVGSLILDACNDDFAGKTPASRVELNVTPGTTYSIRLDGFSGVGVEEGDITLTWGPVGPPPSNDNFSAATVIAGATGTTSGANCVATTEAGEPVDPIGGGKTVWYCWTAPSSGCVFFNTVGSAYDTLICAYTGTALNGLQQVGCNDDFPGKGLFSRVEFQAVAGRQYWIQVDGFQGSHGNFTLNWGADTTPPVNDNFGNPTFIGGSHGSIRGNNCNATFQGGAGEPNPGVGGGLTVWYCWTAPSTTRYAFRTSGSSFDTVLCVFTGPALNSLAAVGCVDDTPGKGLASRVEFDAVSGTIYWIRVDGFQGAFGDIQLSWGCWPRGFQIVLNPNHTVTLSWADPGYTLQSTPKLLNTSNVWTDILGASPITLPAAGASQFYRLQCNDVMAGLPDLIVNPAATVPFISTETFAAGNCEVLEGCATAGTRRLLRFGMETRNIGTASLVLGNPVGNPLFVFASCHMHYHFNNFAEYRLRRNSDSVVVRVGGKVGFCLEDVFRWNPTANPSTIYDCSFQGIQAGWADVYGSHLPCQYIDITGVAPGNYTLELEIDPAHRLPEANEANNVATVPVALP